MLKKYWIKIIYGICGIALFALIVNGIVYVNLIGSDIRNVTKQASIDDVRQMLRIMELHEINSSNEINISKE